ncbi:MAG: HDIG domain-containing protein [Thermodesulfovibrionales bacterium]|nr:HDIG domain-containing protein [Thermodesulfovibrionales bacterium]
MTGMKDAQKNKEKSESRPQRTITPEAFQDHVALIFISLATAALICDLSGIEHFVGSFLLTGLLFYIVYRDILRYKPHYLYKRRLMLLLGFMIVLTVGLGRLSEVAFESMVRGFQIDVGDTVRFGLPIPSGAMLIMLLFDFHTAIVSSVVLALIAGLWQGDPSYTVYVFVSCLTAAFTIIGCRKRTAILRSGVFVFIANIIGVVTVMMFNGELLTPEASYAIVFAFISAVTVVAIVSLLLPVIESVFKVTTDISLLELLDLDHPLMKNLMIAAPGTYHHSIIVGNLVEACSELVGINPLLARVGAYYHDIGKSKMPEYFIENKSMGASKHEKLTPHMSSIVLISHVKEGVDLARQHNLPEDVVDIIEQHHGNTLITYFYEKAKEAPNGESLSEDVYRYPGPKPQTRTAALIMMADAVEASSRVLNDPTPARITALVDKIINHIFLAGQLEECELTLKDIREIKSRFTYILNGILHRRIDYPGFNFNGKGDKGAGESKQQAGKEKAWPQEDTERLPQNPYVPGR